jgi:hypothetical protein
MRGPLHLQATHLPATGGVMAGIDARNSVGGRQVGTIAVTDSERPADQLGAAIAEAEAWLVDSGAALVRCPMGATVWHGHRAMTGGFPIAGGPAPFPLEPVNGPELPDLLFSRGYEVAQRAASFVVPVADWIAAAEFAERRVLARGFKVRELDMTRFRDELVAAYPIALAAFSGAWGFSPITIDEFVAIHSSLESLVATGLSQVLEGPSGEVVGFMFAYPDTGAAGAAGAADARFVAKTIAVAPAVARTEKWLGYGLAVAAHRHAAALGFEFAIHPLEADGGSSQRMSARHGRLMRRYATFEKVLRM